MTVLILVVFSGSLTYGQGKKPMSREEYLKTFSDLAMTEMVRTGIPASITLAQGCLESNNGNSRLAVKGNNHFGIKCHDWTGRKIYQDDDERNECFRSYKSAYESYKDHSEFLTTKSRYASLFDLKPHDYRGWAKGLKKAGYATAPDYASMLIRIIEENELYRFDVRVLEGEVALNEETAAEEEISVPGYEHGYETHRQVMLNNKVEYVLSQPGDTPESLRRELDLYKNEIYRYNSLYRGEDLEPGRRIYLQPKRRKAEQGKEIHVVEEGQTMYDISQIYAVKVKRLYKMNLMQEGSQPEAGTEIFLRRKKKGLPPSLRHQPMEKEEEEEDQGEEMFFRFDG